MPDPPAPPTASTPPTQPGRLPDSVTQPTSRAATWSLICGVVGLLLPLVPIAAIVLGIVALRHMYRGDPPMRGRGLAIGGVCTGAAGLVMNLVMVFIVWSTIALVSQADMMRLSMNMHSLWQQADQFAASSDRYPTHIAELALSSRATIRLHWFQADPAAGAPAGSLMVGQYNVANFDNSTGAMKALREELSAIDTSQPTYRFGDLWFVRLPKPTGDPYIIFAWFYDSDRDVVTFQMDDGTHRMVKSSAWGDYWQSDAEARTRLGLEPIDLPAAPVPARK